MTAAAAQGTVRMGSAPTIRIADKQNYACVLCGRCCRRFCVRITAEEAARLEALEWGDEPDVPRDFVDTLGGRTYFRRRASGGCVFLDEGTGGCRIHARFGFRPKALTCRGYPHNIVSTWPGEVSVVARLDCPAVQQNVGPPLTANRAMIQALVREMGIEGGFTPRQLAGLERATIEAITAALVGLVSGEIGRASCRERV